MYSPHRRKNQFGGQTIPTSLTTTTLSSSATTAALSASTLSSIAGMTNLSSLADISQLSIEQLSSLIRALDTQILSEQGIIAQNQSEIAVLENKITRRPDGLQPQFDLADFIYTSTLNEYNAEMRMLGFYQSTLSTKVTRLAQVSSLTDKLQSTVTGYELEYSTIVSSMGGLGANIQTLNTSYAGYLRQMESLSTNLVTTQKQTEQVAADLSTFSSCVSTSAASYSSLVEQVGPLSSQYVTQSTVRLPELSTTVTVDMSTLTGLQTNQATIISDLYAGLLTTDTSLAPLQTQSTTQQTTLATAKADLTTAQSNYDSAVASGADAATIDSYKTAIDTLSIAIVSQQTAIDTTNADISRIETDLRDAAQSTYAGNLSSISTVYATDFQALQDIQSSVVGLSTSLAALPISQNTLLASFYNCSTAVVSTGIVYSSLVTRTTSYSSQMIQISGYAASTLSSISSLNTLSSLYAFSVGYYISTFTGLSTQEILVNSTIYALTQNRDLIANKITSLEQQVVLLVTSTFSEISRLQGNSDQFYRTKQAAVAAEVNQISYAARQLNAFIGGQCADMILRKLTILTKIDGVNFQLTVTPTDTTLSAKLAEYNQQILFLDNLIQAMQALEPEFANLLIALGNEAKAKQHFIAKRQEITDMDIAFLDAPSTKSSGASAYSKLWLDLESLRVSANAAIEVRSIQLAKIYSLWDPLVADVRSVSPATVFPARITASTLPIVHESDDPTQAVSALSEYALIPPTSFV